MQLKRCYQVRAMGPAEVERKIVVFKANKEGHKSSEQVVKKVKFPETFLVLFPRGHSIRVLSKARLIELGLAEDAQVIDMETGLPPPMGGDFSAFNPIAGSISTGNAFVDALGE